MRLSVVMPEGTLMDRDVTEVYLPGAAGELGVLEDHITFLGNLGTGEIRYKSREGAGTLLMSGGVLEVMSNEVTILADAATLPEHVDVERARLDLAAAEKSLQDHDPFTAAYAAAATARKWAALRIATAGR
jgi:F-type H+-transporting ATPase subunit epsilon